MGGGGRGPGGGGWWWWGGGGAAPRNQPAALCIRDAASLLLSDGSWGSTSGTSSCPLHSTRCLLSTLSFGCVRPRKLCARLGADRTHRSRGAHGGDAHPGDPATHCCCLALSSPSQLRCHRPFATFSYPTRPTHPAHVTFTSPCVTAVVYLTFLNKYVLFCLLFDCVVAMKNVWMSEITTKKYYLNGGTLLKPFLRKIFIILSIYLYHPLFFKVCRIIRQYIFLVLLKNEHY